MTFIFIKYLIQVLLLSKSYLFLQTIFEGAVLGLYFERELKINRSIAYWAGSLEDKTTK